MEIISCYVENFGKLHQFSIDLEKGMNVLAKENGWGKTTMAAFIEAMFYGLDYKPRAKLEDSPRKKYQPWQSGSYGGTMTFFANEKTYRVERSFGKKASEDRFKLFDVQTGLESQDYSEELGKELFGVDRQSYEYTAYLKQGALQMQGTDDIFSSLVGDNYDNTKNDMDSYTKAMKRLDDAAKQLKKTGGRGSIDQTKEQITSLLVEQNKAKQNAELFDQWENQRKSLVDEIRSLKEEAATAKEEVVMAGKVEGSRSKLQQLNSLRKREHDVEVQLEEVKKHFPGICVDTLEIEKQRLTQGIMAAEKYAEDMKQVEVWRTQYETLSANPIEPVDAPQFEQAEVKTSKKKANILWAVLGLLIIAGSVVIATTWRQEAFLGIPAGILCFVIFEISARKARRDNKSVEAEYREQQLQEEELREKQFMKQVSSREKDLANRKQRIDAASEELESLNRELSQLLKSYHMEHVTNQVTGFIMLQEMLKNSERLLKDQLETKEELRQFLNVYSEKELLASANSKLVLAQVLENEKKLEDRLYELLDQEKEVIEKRQQYEGEKERAKELSLEVEELRETLEKEQVKYKTIQKAKELLELARNRYSMKYMGKVCEEFETMVESLLGEKQESPSLDLNLSMSVAAAGMQRELAYFSEGTKDLLWLCERMALVKAIFEKEKPVLVLDDPLSEFDPEHIEKSQAFLTELAKEFQIIYLTCHESRTNLK